MKRSRNSVPKKGRAGAEAQRRERESMQDWKKKKILKQFCSAGLEERKMET